MSENEPTITDLAMLVARLIQQVRKHDPANSVAQRAMDYLRRKDIVGSVLRETTINVTRQANPVGAAGPVAGETEGETETTISVEG